MTRFDWILLIMSCLWIAWLFIEICFFIHRGANFENISLKPVSYTPFVLLLILAYRLWG